eukprot:CAMPEP_0113262982 /NCGR_PEP_ID=MMETSP0008_2-20120614/18211_1 /TAXON_ID=97485 /ORGANISM="Prymnesium parvum" /LENGTH=81 /DNA_ID=CAMNT_0000111675 /DNA_START=137 /DNA_END=379 /DNA_ORIENTATION=+ /assembly_acc=CAM_ASM_000153
MAHLSKGPLRRVREVHPKDGGSTRRNASRTCISTALRSAGGPSYRSRTAPLASAESTRSRTPSAATSAATGSAATSPSTYA